MQIAIIVTVLAAQTPTWKPFTPAGGGFEVQLPGTPAEKRQTVRTPLGNGELRIFAVSTKGGSFAVGVTDFPESAVADTKDDQRLDQARDAAVQQAKMKVRWEKKILVDGMPGRELYLGAEGEKTQMLLILAADRNRLLQLLATGDATFLDGPDTSRFLDSFKKKK
jgi:hypothetical protein